MTGAGGLRRTRFARAYRSRLFVALVALAAVPAILATVPPVPAHAEDAPSVPPVRGVHGVHAVVPATPKKLPAVRQYRPAAVTWPAARSGSVRLAPGGTAAVAGTPVSVQASAPGQRGWAGPSSLDVAVADHQKALGAGVAGMVFTATARGGSVDADHPVRVSVDYRDFASAYGGNYASRLRLVSLPACALRTPQIPACRTQTPLAGARNDAGARTVSALLPAGTQGSVVLAATGASDGDGGGPAGNYKATDLKASGTWSAGGSTGSFTYSYPITVPPAASSLVPTVGLSYDSGSVDGQTAASQAQAGWAGDGWSTPHSYIEQSFTACSNSPEGSAAPKSTADECYDGPVLTMSLDGTSTALVWDAGKKTFTPAQDNGDVVTHVTNSGNGTGTYNTDYWSVTDQSGTVYLFGRNRLPGWASGDQETNSVDSEPVFSAHSGDPCYNASDFSSSKCTMAYRWNLDYVKDVHGNAMAYYYKQDSNAYAVYAKTSSATSYIRDSYLDHIDYGFVDGAAYTVNGGHAPDQVLFTTGDRCVSGTCDPLNSTNAKNWPDVPYDLHCTSGSSCDVVGPSFWSTVRLTGIKTQQWNGSGYAAVDSWKLDETMPDSGDGTAPTLWLSDVIHTGSDAVTGGSAVALPPVSFSPVPLQNRVATHDGLPVLTRYRIGQITTETGEVIGVNYEQVSPCAWPVTVTPASNTSSCFPVYWTPNGYTKQILDWFNKWQVAAVTEADPTGGAPTMYTSYQYLGGGAWHFDDNEVVKAKYRTYGQWRGYGDVKTFTGQGNDAQTENETTYYRGMSKDNNDTAVTLTDSQGGVHEDVDQLAGDTLETTGYDYSGGPVLHSTITSYWVSPPTASRSRTGLPALTANASGVVETWTRDAVTSGGTTTWRRTETDTSFDADLSSATFGLPLVVFAHGDLADPTQQRCTVTSYAKANTGKNLVGLPAEVEADADACGGANPGGASAPTSAQVNALTAPASVQRPGDVVSDQRTFYDDATLAAGWPQAAAPAWPQQAPAFGDVSETRVAAGYSGGAFTYQVKSSTVYDSYGRPVDTYDALGRKTHVAYTMANGVTVATGATNPLNQTATQSLDPLRGLPTVDTDANGVSTTTHYDGLGRTTAIWGYGRATTSAANAKFTYQVSATAPTAVTTQVMNDSQGYVTSTTLYDALLRQRQTQQSTPAGGRLVTDTFYDTRGWAWKTNTNWWDPATTPGTTLVSVPDSQVHQQDIVAFDGAGQAVLDTSYDDSTVKSRKATVYQGDRSITVPLDASGKPYPGGTAQATVTDGLGRTTELDSYTTPPTVNVSTVGTPPITRVSVTGGTSQATRYLFNNVGQQTDVRDVSTGEDWGSTFNLLGQQTSRRDPDAGTTAMSYDAAGNLVQSTDARGRTLSFTYDALNRKTGEYDAPASGQSAANQLASWTYDNANNAVPGMSYPIGHVTTTVAKVGGNSYVHQAGGFDVFGNATSETIGIPASEGNLAGSYTFTHLYSTGTGLLLRDGYPASPGGALPEETVTHGYSGAMDVPVSLGGLATYTANVTTTAYGQVAQEELGNHQAAHAYLTNTFDPHTGALTDSTVGGTGTPTDETSYAYDPAGNPVSQTENRQGTSAETQCYGYDNLDRLVQAWTGTDRCAADPSGNNGATVGSGISGAYWTSWSFDPLGQRTKQVQHGTAGTGDTVTTYAYNTGQPNTLASTATTGPGGSTATSYGYDAVGDTTSRTTPAQGQQAMTWSDDGQLTAVTGASGGSSYIYDADGNLLLQKDPGTTTLYLPGEQLALDTATGAVAGTRLYDLPGGGQVVRAGAGTDYSFELGDQQGTGLLTLDAALTHPSWRQQTPYGAPRGTTPLAWPDNRGFLNQPQDGSTGLTDVGVRWYDPSIGRFISVDPVFEADAPQQVNGYTYAASNPVGDSDPSGMRACEGSTGDNACAPGQRADGKPKAGRGSPACEYMGACGIGRGGRPSYGRPADMSDYLAALARIERQRQQLLHKIAQLKAQVEQLKRSCATINTAHGALQPCNLHGGDFPQYLADVMDVLSALGESLASMPDVGPLGEGMEDLGPLATDLRAWDEEAAGDARALQPLAHSPIAADLASTLRQERSLIRRMGELSCDSFAGDVKVLRPDGSAGPIDQVKVGDVIADAVPGAGPGTRDQAHVVTAVHVTYTDRDYTDVTLATPTGPQTITGTSHHLYWDTTTRAWTRADHLRVGDLLQTSGGGAATIAALRTYTASMVTYNLTVDGLHTYYVDGGTVPVLVHNDPGSRGPWGNAHLWQGGKFPVGGAIDSGGPSGGVYYRMNHDGAITNYAVYDSDGIIKYRVDLIGATHAGVKTPHYQPYKVNTNPKTGAKYPRETGEAFPGVGPDGGPPFGC